MRLARACVSGARLAPGLVRSRTSGCGREPAPRRSVPVPRGGPSGSTVRIDAAGLRASSGAALTPYERAAVERTLDVARASVGVSAVDITWSSAQATPQDQVVDEAHASH